MGSGARGITVIVIIKELIFRINAFFQQHNIYTPQNYSGARFQKHFSPSVTIKGKLAGYLQLHDLEPVCDRFATMPTK